MNRFHKPPETETVINGKKYFINDSFDGCLLVWDAYDSMMAGELSELGYAALIIDVMYKDDKPDIFSEEALKFASDFLNHYNDKDENEPHKKSRIPPVSIRQDWEMIVSSFLSMNIDLRTEIIDYGKFLYLLRNLPEGCEYANIMRLRRQYYEERHKMKPKERQRFMQDIDRVGRNKIIIKNRKSEVESENNDRSFKEMINAERAKKNLPPKYKISEKE